MASKKLPLAQILNALDRKDRNYYKNLSDEDKKQVPFVPLLRYMSSVKGTAMEEQYNLLATNSKVNKNFFDISAKDHGNLLWLLLTTVSLNIGSQYHEWIAFKKGPQNKKAKLLMTFHPAMKEDEVELLSTLYTDKELIAEAVDRGMDEKAVKKLLK